MVEGAEEVTLGKRAEVGESSIPGVEERDGSSSDTERRGVNALELAFRI